MFELVIWPQEVTLTRWTQPLGPLCLWQCLDLIPDKKFTKTLQLSYLSSLSCLTCLWYSVPEAIAKCVPIWLAWNGRICDEVGGCTQASQRLSDLIWSPTCLCKEVGGFLTKCESIPLESKPRMNELLSYICWYVGQLIMIEPLLGGWVVSPPTPFVWIHQTEEQGLIGIEEVQDLVPLGKLLNSEVLGLILNVDLTPRHNSFDKIFDHQIQTYNRWLEYWTYVPRWWLPSFKWLNYAEHLRLSLILFCSKL